MAMTPEEQGRYDKLEINIRPVVNGWIIKRGGLWYVAKTQEEAEEIVSNILCEQRKMLLADRKPSDGERR